jgi:predicted branched-subunit amino acid permease
LAAQLTIDESNAVSAAQTDAKQSRLGFWLTGAAVFVFWNSFTFLGALLGTQVGDPSRWGLDAAAAAAFLGLLWPRLRMGHPGAIAIVAVVLTALFIGPLPAGIPVIVASPLAVAGVMIWQRFVSKKISE